MAEEVTFTGPCPLIWCEELDVHTHIVCERCGCLGATNPMCEVCLRDICTNFPPVADLFIAIREQWDRLMTTVCHE